MSGAPSLGQALGQATAPITTAPAHVISNPPAGGGGPDSLTAFGHQDGREDRVSRKDAKSAKKTTSPLRSLRLCAKRNPRAAQGAALARIRFRAAWAASRTLGRGSLSA